MKQDAEIARHLTAIKRYDFSKPVRLALDDGLIDSASSVFDYGCGQGDDVRLLQKRGVNIEGWDPVFSPNTRITPADVVNLGYVVNVIESPMEREDTLRTAWNLAQKVLIVSARLSVEARPGSHVFFSDGFLTNRGTFQKFFEQDELKLWIENTLGEVPVAIAPGIFYTFKNSALRQSFTASKYRRRIVLPRVRRSVALFDENRAILEPLMSFFGQRGRLPEEDELPTFHEIEKTFGNVKRAFSIIRSVSAAGESWDAIIQERTDELLVYLALARFEGRPILAKLPQDLQLDIRAFFTTYKTACDKADELLFSLGKMEVINSACLRASVGKATPEAFYVHEGAIMTLPPLLRLYEGCARAYIGRVEGANIIKLSRKKPKVSYLAYPEFERIAHPVLKGSLVVHFQNFQVQYREYSNSENPPILHRKEEFISKNHPLRPKFVSLTKQEEKLGLYDNSVAIGTREVWNSLLESKGVQIRGHRLQKKIHSVPNNPIKNSK